MVILASDGYPELFDTLQETEEHLQKIIQEDPLCYKLQSLTKAVYPGQCSYDDRSYIRFVD
jgi:glycerophosphoryl diester phosphodiesterase